MIRRFRNKGTEDVFDGFNSKDASKLLPTQLHKIARRKLERLNAATTLDGLRVPPGNYLKPLRRDRNGQHSIRINDQYRICFVWLNGNSEDVEITDYHD